MSYNATLEFTHFKLVNDAKALKEKGGRLKLDSISRTADDCVLILV